MHKHAHTHARTHARARAHTHTHTHTRAYRQYWQSIIYTQLKTGGKQRQEKEGDSSTERKTWQVYSFGKRNILRFDLNESREGFYRRGRERSFHVEGLQTEKVLEPTVYIRVHVYRYIYVGLWL